MESNKYLVHFGIKGMHWGIRRFQSPDGSLTKEGKRRYSDTYDKGYDPLNRKKRSKLSDDELKKRIARTELEVRLKRLQRENRNETAILGEQISQTILKSIGPVITAGSAVVAGRQIVRKMFKNADGTLKPDMNKELYDDIMNMILVKPNFGKKK